MKRRLLASILAFVIVLSLLPTAVLAEDQGEDGFQGITIATEGYSATNYGVDSKHLGTSTTISYKIDKDTLYIEGNGDIPNYSNTEAQTSNLYFKKADWYTSRDSIKRVVIGAGITQVGELTITNMTKLESIEIQGKDVTLVNGAVNNYEGNNNQTLTVTVPLSVYQQNQMGKMKWFTPASRVNINNPAINFSISDSNDIGNTFSSVLELSTENSNQWTKQNISDIINEYNRYSALPDVVKTKLNENVGQPLTELYTKAMGLRGWPEGAKGINIALEDFDGSNGKIGTSDTFWYLLDGSTLKLGGDGAFPYTGYDSSSATDHNLGFSHASWYGDRDSITSVDVAEGITKLDYLNLTNLYNCDDIYLRNPQIELVNGAVCGYAGDANVKLTLHLYKSAYDKLPSGWYMLNNVTTEGSGRYLDPTLSYSFLEVEAFESKYADIWNLGVSLDDAQKETVKAAYGEYQKLDALFQNQLMNVDTLSDGQTYGAKLLELYSLTTGGTVAKFPDTTDIYYSYDEATKTLTLTYTGSGTGTIPDYNEFTAPLGSVQIENVVIDSKITSVGAYALAKHGDITVYASVNTTLAENYAAGSTVTLIYSETQAFIDTYAKVWTLTGVVPSYGIKEDGVFLNADVPTAVENAVKAYKKLDIKVKDQLKELKIDGGSTYYYEQLLKVTGANDLDTMTKISGGIPNGMDENGCFTYMDGIHWTLTKNDEGTDTWTLRFDTDEGVKAALPDFGNSTTNTTATDFRNQPWYSNCFSSAFKNKVTKTYLGEGITGVGRYGLIHLSECRDFYFENPDGVDLAGYAFDYYNCFPAFTPNIYLHSNSTLAANWADDLNKGADADKNHTTADFNLIYTDALDFEKNKEFETLWTMNAADANAEENASIIKRAMDAYSALSDKAKEQLKKDKCNGTDTYADKLMALAKAIGLAGDIGTIQYTISSDGKTLTVTGSGTLSADNSAWTEAKVGSVENLVIESAITINKGALNNMTALKTVDAVRGVKVSGDTGVFPNKDIVIRGYADAQKDSLESYAKENSIKFQLKELNILCIGNSHTYDYTTYMQSILNDVNANLEGTKVQLSFIQHGSRKIGITQTYSDGKATNYSHESCIHDVVNRVKDSSATSSNDVDGDYFKNLNPASNTWDLIIIQDYRESCMSASDNATNNNNQDYVFINHLRDTIKDLRLLQPTAQVAWFMDWMDTYDYSNHLDRYTANSLANYTAASDETKGNPDFIIAGATFIGNAMTSYLGQSKNLEDTKPLHTADTTTVPQLWRDNTHMSYETGRYLAGASVAAKLFTDVFSKEITFKEGADFYSALSYNPNSNDSNVRQDWPGEFTPEIAEIVKASAKAAIENPTKITTLTKYAKDPIEDLKALVESADFTNTKWNETAIKAKAEAVLAEKAGAQVTSVNVSGDAATITLRYGYSEATAKIYTPSDAAARWTSYIESTKLGSTTVPGSDMKYSEAQDIQKAMADGYSAIWAAKNEEAATKALEDSKTALLNAVKGYVKFLADTVYNNGEVTVIGDKSYTVSESDYSTAVTAINGAENVADVLSAYDTMLSKQTSKDHPTLTKTESKAATCTEAGNNAYWTCSGCGKYFSDKDGTNEIAKDSWVIPTTRHDWSNHDGICKVCKTPCGEAHIAGRICPVCGKYTPAPTPVIPVTPSKPAKPSFNPDAGKTKFVDVSDNAWYASAVDYAVDKGLMNGTGSNKFSPNADTTRGMIVTVLARLDGKNTAGTPWFAAGQRWAMEYEISDGTNMTGAITREQLVAMLFRYAVKNGLEAVTLSENLTQFTDASDISAWAVSAMQWAVGQGLIQGSNGQLHPQANASRAEVAMILMRFCELMKK